MHHYQPREARSRYQLSTPKTYQLLHPMKVRRGSVTVSVIAHAVKVKGKDYEYHRVRYFQDGIQHRPVFKVAGDAIAFAEKKATELSNGRTAANQVTPEDAASIARIKQILAEKGITEPPELAISRYCEHVAAAEKVGRESSRALFSSLVKDFLAFKSTDGTRHRQRKDLRCLLTVLQETIKCPLDDLNAAGINEILATLQTANAWSNRTRNHYRAALSNLVTWAGDNQKIRRDWKEMDYVKKLKERDGAIVIWTPEEAAQLFATAEAHMPDLVPALVLACFIGHRQSEATGSDADDVSPIDWSDLNLETGEGYLEEGKVRTAGNRITYIPENARAWLKLHRKKTGPICPYKNLNNQYAKLAKLAGIDWKQNANRRSYISYRLAETRNLPQISEEVGTSISTLRKRYAKPRPLTEARKYFNIMPTPKQRKRGNKTVTVEFGKKAKPAKKQKSQKIAKTFKTVNKKRTAKQ